MLDHGVVARALRPAVAPHVARRPQPAAAAQTCPECGYYLRLLTIALELVIIGQVLVEEEALIHAIQVRHIHPRRRLLGSMKAPPPPPPPPPLPLS